MTARVFRVVLEFVDDFADHDHPSQWRWSALLDQPDVRLLEVTERPAPEEAGPMTALTARATADACGAPHEYLCLTCGAAWCHDCDPAPAACCHYCHGRGYSTAEITPPAPEDD